MQNWNSFSLRKQLLSLFIIILFLLLLGSMLFFSHNQHQSYLGQLKKSLKEQALLIREQPVIKINSTDTEFMDSWTKTMGERIDKRITIIDREGIVLADSDYNPVEMDNHLNRPEVQETLAGKDIGISIRYSNTLKMEMYYLALPVNKDGKLLGFIRLSKSLQEINKAINNNIRNNIFFFIFMLFITLMLVWKFTSDITNPLSKITRMARKLAEGNFKEKINLKQYNNEIGTLASAFNNMAKQLESKITQISEEKNRAEAILTSMVDGLVATDMDLRIRLINPAARKIFGLKNQDIEGKKAIEIFRHHQIDHLLAETLRKNKIINKEIIIQKDNGRNLMCNFAPVNNDNNQVIGGIVVFSDITELRRLEQLRKDFVSNVSHELRTPLTSIIGYLDTIMDNEIKDISTMERFLKIIKMEADRLFLLIKDLLDLSKLENKQSYVLRPGSLNRVIEKTITVLQKKALEKEIELKTEIEADFMVEMIPEQIEQVLINLVDNAIKYTPCGGDVTVRVYQSEGENNKVVIEVEDNGIGIPVEEQDRIFERFYRVDKARSRSLGGTGIGLSIVKHILMNHENKITVESEAEKGTIFRFTLDLVS